MVVDDAYVYWGMDDGRVRRAPVGGGGFNDLASGQGYVYNLALSGPDLYFLTDIFEAGSLRRVPAGGGAPVEVSTAFQLSSAGGLTFDATYVYFARDTAVYRMPLAGGAVTTLYAVSSGSEYLSGMAIDGDHRYVTGDLAGMAGGFLRRVPLGGGAATPLAVVPL